MSEVAAASEISTATLFNYFPTKGILAESWVRGELEAVLSGATGRAVEQGRNLRAAIRGAIRELASATAAEPEVRLEAWREAGRASGREASDAKTLVEDLRTEQERERVRSDVEAQDLAALLIDAIEGGLVAGLARTLGGADADSVDAPRVVPARSAGETSLDTLLAQTIQTRVDLVIDGFRKRNERVSLRAPARRVPADLVETPRPAPRGTRPAADQAPGAE